MKKFYKLLSSPYILLLTILVILPMLMIVFEAFKIDGKFSFSPLAEIFTNDVYLKVLTRSIWMAIQVSIVCLIIALPMALIMWRMDKKWKFIITIAISMPLWINLVARVRVMDNFLDGFSFLSDSSKVLVAFVFIYIPFMLISINNQLEKVKYTFVDAAVDLGASKFTTLVKVIIPLVMPGILAGINLVFLPAATAVVVPQIIDSNNPMLGNIIYSFAQPDSYYIAAALTFVVIVIMIGFIALIEWSSRRNNLDK